MKKEEIIRRILPGDISMTPEGILANELSIEQFHQCIDVFFDEILKISTADITGIEGYGEFDEEGKTKYSNLRDFLIGTFDEVEDGYWYHWKEMFETNILDKKFFDEYYDKMLEKISFCEGKRYLVYNNTFFSNMVTDAKTKVGFPDWSRSGICDWIIDLVIMDLNKPYLMIPELFVEYAKKNGIDLVDFNQRFLCLAYYKGLDTLRWHASIDDLESCNSIMESMTLLEKRFQEMGY